MAKLTKKPAAKAKKPVKAAVKKTAAKKPAAKKVAAKKTVVKKAVVKKVVVKKTAVKKTATKKPTSKIKAAPKSKGLPEQLLEAALKVLDERQAEEIITVPLAGRSSLADYLIIASGRAGRQVTAIADHLRDAFFKLGARQVRIEGQQDANWVLVDVGDIIIHLFRPEVRRYYDLDSLWNGKPAK